MAWDHLSRCLGLRSLFFPSNNLIAADGRSVSRRSSFATALTVQLANPKLILFLAALVPQFLEPTHPIPPQLAVLGGIFMLSLHNHLLAAVDAGGTRPAIVSQSASNANCEPGQWSGDVRRSCRVATK